MLLTYELLFQRPALVDGTSRRRGPEPAERQFPRQVRARTLGHRPSLHGKNLSLWDSQWELKLN